MDSKRLDKRIEALIEEAANTSEHGNLLREVIATVLRLSENHVAENDIQIIHTALKDMRFGFKFFAPYKDIRKVSVFGSARTKPSESIYQHSAEFARHIVTKGFMVITGAGDGIMRAAQEGAGRHNSFGVNIILPFEQTANEFIMNDPKLMTFKYFFTRKLFFVKEADAIALFPGGFGTHDEGFESLTLLQTGKTEPMPIVLIDVPGGTYWKSWLAFINDELVERGLISAEDLSLFKVTDQIETAVSEIASFYHNYNSSCFFDPQTVIRLHHPVEKTMLEQLNDRFSDIVVRGKIEATGPLPEEERSHEDGLHRIVFDFNQRSFGRFRQLINMINQYHSKTEPLNTQGDS